MFNSPIEAQGWFVGRLYFQGYEWELARGNVREQDCFHAEFMQADNPYRAAYFIEFEKLKEMGR